LTGNLGVQLLDLAIHQQQNLDNDLAALVVDRLCLSALHTPIFGGAELCPPTD